jgi:hypothetical protein
MKRRALSNFTKLLRRQVSPETAQRTLSPLITVMANDNRTSCDLWLGVLGTSSGGDKAIHTANCLSRVLPSCSHPCKGAYHPIGKEGSNGDRWNIGPTNPGWGQRSQ